MWIQIVTLVLKGQSLAILPIPTSYRSFDECETYAYTASQSVVRRDDVSEEVQLTIVCQNSEEILK